jgi:hypothetical protein|tara:strand:+ start:716 stop:1108 length:393 start_codon:yes stop_codon:yes gene_type:complete
MSFQQDLNKYQLKLQGLTNQQLRGTLYSFSSAVIKGTPVDTGRLRGNWQASITTPITSKVDRLDQTGNTSTSDVKNVLKSFKTGMVFYLTNNLPYANKMEYGGSAQAPQGMVRINIQRLKSSLESRNKSK